ncbi:ATP-binding cassette domain-containing protein [Enterococcus durans]|uniref:ATP-binding cassette domain-containing protein n=1 Tax=Enterococcus durans TaxID=53345 RepID=UPI0009C1A518|nr:ABC transporter ATP-binding protein [Enterococcus durans]OQO82245.1 multidrug ABC transporter ATP-binding protein [Enterococcus durans]
MKKMGYLFSGLMALEPVFTSWAFSRVFVLVSGHSYQTIVQFIGLVLAFFVLFAGIKAARTWFVNQYVKEVNADIKHSVLMQEYENQIKHETEITPGRVEKTISFIQNDCKQYEEKNLMLRFDVVRLGTTAVFSILFAVYNSALLAVIFVAFSFLPIIVQHFTKDKVKNATQAWTKQAKEFYLAMTEFLKGLPAFYQYGAIGENEKVLQGEIDKIETKNKNMKTTLSLAGVMIELIGYIAFFIPIGFGIVFVNAQMITLAAFMAVLNVNNGIINSIISLMNIKNSIDSVSAIETEIKDTTSTKLSPVIDLSSKSNQFESLKLEGVQFQYNGKEILSAVDLQINSGERILIQGKSGAGKSTLLKIIEGRIIPDAGRLTMNGTFASTSDVNHLFGIIHQKPIIFKNTLLYNLTLGKTVDLKIIEEACEKENLTELVARFGLTGNQLLDPDSNLSGGEMKRIEIARSLVFDRPILIVDEGTASLDEQTSAEIHENLFSLGRTIIEVDHHIPQNLLNHYSQRLVLESGKLSREI